jgi:sugar phosphate permease
MKSVEMGSVAQYNTTDINRVNNQQGSLKAWSVLACAWAFYLYEYVLRVSPSVMTNELMLDFGVTSTALGVLVSFYYFSYVALQVPCGVIVDWLGPRKVITFSAVLCVVGSVFFAQSETLSMAQLGRFLIGAGSACGYLSCAKVGAEWFHSSKFAMIAGMTMMMGTLGGTFGSLPFAVLSNSIGWRSSMFIAASVGACIAFAAWIIVRDYPNSDSAVAQAKHSHEGESLLDGLKVVVSNPQNWLIGLYGCMMYLPLSAFAELWGVPFLMQLYGINNELASSAVIMVFLGMALGSLLGPWMSNRYKSRKKIMSWAAIGTLLVFVVVFYVPSIPLSFMFPLLFIGGLFSGGQILYFAAAKEINPSNISGTTIGFTNCLVMVSGVIFQPLLGMLLDLAWDGQMTVDGAPEYTLATYKIAFSVYCVALLVSWIVVQYVRETYADVSENN